MTFPHGHVRWGIALCLSTSAQRMTASILRLDVHPTGVSSGAQQVSVLLLPCSGSTAIQGTTCALLASGGWKR